MRGNIILDLCGGSGSWSKPYRDAGYDVRVITLPEQSVVDYIPPKNVYGILSAPPCVEFSIAKDHKLERDIIGGMHTVNACIRIIALSKPKFWALENPVGLLHKWLDEPKLKFHPWFYGDPWTKKTAIWGEFNTPEQMYHRWEDVPKNDDLYIRPGRKKPSIAFLHKSAVNLIPQLKGYEPEDDSAFRAITPPGFANAFFRANQ